MSAQSALQENSAPLADILSKSKQGFVPVILLSCAFNLLMLVSPIYMMQVFDRVLASGRVETLIVLTFLVIVALVVLGQMDTFRQRILARIGIWLDQSLALPVLKSSFDLALDGTNPGAQPLRDLGQLRGFLASQAVLPIIDIPWVPIFIGMIFMLHPLLGGVALFGAIGLLGLSYFSERVTRKPLQKAGEAQLTAFSQAEKAVRMSEVVYGMGLMKNLLLRWANANNKVLHHQQFAADRAAEIGGFTKTVRFVLQTAILGFGAWLVLENQLTAGGMIAASILLGRGLAPVEQSVGAWKGFLGARAAYDRLARLLAHAPDEKPRMPLTKPAGHLSVEGVTFVPKGSRKPILKNISFSLAPGEALAIVGPSAAGKSTLCRQLIGLRPATSGLVRLDGADVTQWDREDFGRHIGYLPQSIDLFDGTIAENIARMGAPDSEEVIKAAHLAGVHEMILRLPEGYDTQVVDNGAILSGGQRQRIGLARALYGSPALLVLDEPNSNLDQEGEAALMKTIDALRASGTTIVMVAHRSTIVSHVDKILLLINGQMKTFGPAEEVIRQLSSKQVNNRVRAS